MKKAIILLGGLFLGANAYAQHMISVKVDDLKSRTGRIVVNLCKDSEDFLNKSFRQEIITIPASGDVVALFQNVPSGTYAIRIFQDENSSGKLEYNLIGIPKEGVGFSKNPAMQFGPPSFADASFVLDKSRNETIKVRKFSIL